MFVVFGGQLGEVVCEVILCAQESIFLLNPDKVVCAVSCVRSDVRNTSTCLDPGVDSMEGGMAWPKTAASLHVFNLHLLEP